MTKEHLKNVLQFYARHLENLWPGVLPEQLIGFDATVKGTSINHPRRIAHFKFMCLEAQRFIDRDQTKKAMRWLGFLQGAMWSHNHFSLDALKDHSKPPVVVVDTKTLRARVEELMVGARMAANQYTGKTTKINIIPVKGIDTFAVASVLVHELYVEGCNNFKLDQLPDGSIDFVFTLPKENT